MASSPNVRLLHFLMIGIGGTLGGSLAKPLGGVGIVVGSLFGSLLFWILSRAIARRLF